MKQRKIITSAVFLLLGLGGLHAQETVPATGGDAIGSGGSSSYTVGQVIYTTDTGNNGSVAQGVQQPYEISIVTGVKETEINLELTAYPNPTTDFLTLKIDSDKKGQLNYQLFDLQGKLLINNQLSSSKETIPMENLPTSTYFLKVVKDNSLIKAFKIIKN